MKPIDLEAVRAQLSYDPDAGIFRWLVSKRGSVKAGDIAGSPGERGYWRVKVNQVTYRAGRLAWAMVHNDPNPPEVDHENRNRADNRFRNLRPATRSQNNANREAAGCRFEIDRNKWLARISFEGKQINLGRFNTEAEARDAYRAAKVKYFGEFSPYPRGL